MCQAHCQTGRNRLLVSCACTCRSQRHEAAEHPDWQQQRGEAVRLWVCPRHVVQHHGSHVHQGHAALHGTRTGAGAAVQPHGTGVAVCLLVWRAGEGGGEG
eukprot:364434-Chlamydomonas_euryale.AAC.6